MSDASTIERLNELKAQLELLERMNDEFVQKPNLDSLQARINQTTTTALKQATRLLTELIDENDELANVQEMIESLDRRDRADLRPWILARYDDKGDPSRGYQPPPKEQ